jgi:hypothetical protein
LANWGWTIYNELHDRKVDAINKPHKPLPSGQVDHYNVTLLFFFLMISEMGVDKSVEPYLYRLLNLERQYSTKKKQINKNQVNLVNNGLIRKSRGLA